MTTYNHTAIATGAAANAATFNNPLGALDAAIGDRTTLSTAAKSSLVAALNELDTGKADVLPDQAANLVFAGPTTGSAQAPAFRSLVSADLPASGVTPGSYPKVTVDAKGRVTGGSAAIGNEDIAAGAGIEWSKISKSGATAADVANVPAGGLAATTVQAALNELDSEKAAAAHTHTRSAITDLTDQAVDTFANPTDTTNGNATIARHGFMPKLVNDAMQLINGIGAWVKWAMGVKWNGSAAYTPRSYINFKGAGVTIADDPANDKLDITITGTAGGASAFADLTDVELTSPANNEVPRYNASAAKWVNTPLASLIVPGHTIQDDGTNLANQTTLNFKDGIKAAVSGGVITIEPTLRENALICGTFDFFQRSDPATWTATFSGVSGVYSTTRKFAADRWAVQCNEIASGTVAVQTRRYNQNLTDDANGEKAMALRLNGATGRIAAYQIIESFVTAGLLGKRTVFQVMLRAGVNARTVRIGIAKYTGTPDTVPAKLVAAAASWTTNPTLGTNLTWIANSTDLTVSTSQWHQAIITADLTAVTDATNLIVAVYDTADSTASDDVLYFRRAFYGIGSQLATWTPRHPILELAMCRRYFWKNYAVDVPPGASGSSFVPNYIVLVSSISNGAYYIYFQFPFDMRVQPTITTYSGQGTAGRASNASNVDYAADSAKINATTRANMMTVYNGSGGALTITSFTFFLGISVDAEI